MGSRPPGAKPPLLGALVSPSGVAVGEFGESPCAIRELDLVNQPKGAPWFKRPYSSKSRKLQNLSPLRLGSVLWGLLFKKSFNDFSSRRVDMYVPIRSPDNAR